MYIYIFVCRRNRKRATFPLHPVRLNDVFWMSLWRHIGNSTQWAKSSKKQSGGVYFWQYGTVFWVPNFIKTHSFRLLFWRFCPLGML